MSKVIDVVSVTPVNVIEVLQQQFQKPSIIFIDEIDQYKSENILQIARLLQNSKSFVYAATNVYFEVSNYAQKFDSAFEIRQNRSDRLQQIKEFLASH